MKRLLKPLKISRTTVRILAPGALRLAAGVPAETTAATDGNTGCQSEATGCHTGFSGCGTC
jgi:hypothetical protein